MSREISLIGSKYPPTRTSLPLTRVPARQPGGVLAPMSSSLKSMEALTIMDKLMIMAF